MKKAIMVIASLGLVAAGMMAASPIPATSHQVEVRTAPAEPPAPVKPAPRQSAIREQRSLGDAVRAMRIPTAHKNRAGGERANRRWRKVRASGRS